jgi:hypothetical protein
LRGETETEIGDGTVARAIRSLQREFWRPPRNADWGMPRLPGTPLNPPRPLKIAP